MVADRAGHLSRLPSFWCVLIATDYVEASMFLDRPKPRDACQFVSDGGLSCLTCAGKLHDARRT